MNRTVLPQVAIVLVNWNSRSDTLECLESVFRLRYPTFSVVVCDNASADGTLDAVAHWAVSPHEAVAPASADFVKLLSSTPRAERIDCVRLDRGAAEAVRTATSKLPLRPLPPLTLIDTGGNLGFAGGNNVGIRYALQQLQAEYVWLLNTDTVVDPDALDTLVARAQRDPGLGMVGSTLVFYWAPDKVQVLGGGRVQRRTAHTEHIGDGTPVAAIPRDSRAVEQEMSYVVGASMLVSRAFVEQVGLMNESYFLYSEETDFDLRAGDAGFSARFVPTAGATHLEGESGGSTRLWPLLVVNRVRFFRQRHGRLSTAAYWGAVLFREASRAALGRAPAKAAVRALIDPQRLRTPSGPEWIR